MKNDIYWRSDIGETSPSTPPILVAASSSTVSSGSSLGEIKGEVQQPNNEHSVRSVNNDEGPDDLRINNNGNGNGNVIVQQQNHSPTLLPTRNPYDIIDNIRNFNNSNNGGSSAHSAFTAIQTGARPQLPPNIINGSGLPSRCITYLPYESTLAFPKAHHNQHLLSSIIEKPTMTNASFPNQLISLHQIRNYSHQPTMTMTTSPVGSNSTTPNTLY